MANSRDSGYPRVPAGNIQTDFVWGTRAPQTNDDRQTSPTYNATGGGAGDKGWSTTTDIASAKITANDFSVTANQLTLTAFGDNHVNIVNQWDAFPGNTSYTGHGDNWPMTAGITAASTDGSTVTYTSANAFVAGQRVTITGLTNALFNLTGVVIATANATTFTVSNTSIPNGTTALSAQTGKATVTQTFATVTAASANGTTITYTATNTFTAGNIVTVTGLGIASGSSLNIVNLTIASASGSQFTVTAPVTGVASGTGTAVSWPLGYPVTVVSASGNGTTTTYTCYDSSNLVAGQKVTVTGLPTTSGSSLNVANATIATAGASTFTVTQAVTGTSSGTGLAIGYTAATVPNVVGKTYMEADRLLGVGDLMPGYVSYTTTGALASDQTVIVTGASASGGTVTYTTVASTPLVTGQTVSVFGLPTAAFNLANQTVLAGATSTQFQVTNAATGTTVSGFTGTTANITAVSSNGTTHTYTAANSFTAGQLVTISGVPAVTAPGGATYNLVNATVASASGTQFTVTPGTAVTSGVNFSNLSATALGIGASARAYANVNTVYSQSVAAGASNVLPGTSINLVVYRAGQGENVGTQNGTFTPGY